MTLRFPFAPPILIAVAAIVGWSHEPSSGPASSPSSISPVDVPALLAAVRDNTFNFDEPAFYWLVDQARREPGAVASSAPLPWRFLLERPSEYRGRRVMIEGFVQSSLGYKILRNGVSFGHVCQTELADAGTRGLCTIVSTNDAQPAPLGARVRAVAWFLKVRQFKTTSGGVSTAPLLVAHRLEILAGPQALTQRMAARRTWTQPRDLLMLATAVLAIVWLLLRRSHPARMRTGRRRTVTRGNPPADEGA